ncbi:hypothetical protein PAMC26510_25780 [Caballeronia sordidicola]|uniref:Uncharacterized protein n=1 Tax=Caballeronia sordidicola TaxID=196367 RepID=A0A242MG86_CABSO|nr:hypothetical protein PAMC26510_25780 [Caballeronia sordidicola]
MINVTSTSHVNMTFGFCHRKTDLVTRADRPAQTRQTIGKRLPPATVVGKQRLS